jgi:uncharacterized membrane protein
VEIILAIFLLYRMAVAIYLILIFPANIYVAVVAIPAHGSTEVNGTALWIRLIFQQLLIGCVLIVTKER